MKLLHAARIYLAPDHGGPAGASGTPKNPATRGVTVKERESRSASERELSPDNEGIVPSIGEIAQHLDTHGQTFDSGKAAPKDQQEESEESEEEPKIESEQQEQGATEEASETSQEEESETVEGEQQEQAITDKNGRKVELPPEVQASINARIGELTKEKHALKGEIEVIKSERDQLQTQLSAQPVKVAATPMMPLADVTTMAELQARAAQAQRVKVWCIENPEGAEVEIKDGEKMFYSPEEIRAIHANAERELSAVPGRQAFLQGKAAADEITRKAYPDAFKAGTESSQQLQAVKRALPWLAVLPDADLIILDAIAGKALRESKAQKPNPLAKPAPSKVNAPASPKSAPRVPAGALKGRDARANMDKEMGSQRSVREFAETLV